MKIKIEIIDDNGKKALGERDYPPAVQQAMSPLDMYKDMCEMVSKAFKVILEARG